LVKQRGKFYAACITLRGGGGSNPLNKALRNLGMAPYQMACTFEQIFPLILYGINTNLLFEIPFYNILKKIKDALKY